VGTRSRDRSLEGRTGARASTIDGAPVALRSVNAGDACLGAGDGKRARNSVFRWQFDNCVLRAGRTVIARLGNGIITKISVACILKLKC
jgi:hypothetical protein